MISAQVRRSPLRFVLAAMMLILAGAASPVAAHPHVWIVAYSDVVFDDAGKIVAINVEWQFDEFYSTYAVEGLDENGDGRYDAGELQGLASENIKSLSDFNYLMEVMVDGLPAAFGAVEEYGSSFRDSYLSLHFRLPLERPVDPAAEGFYYRMFDPSFYIAIEVADEGAITAVGAAPQACHVRLERPGADSDEAPQPESIYEDVVTNEGLGALYADTIRVSCDGETSS